MRHSRTLPVASLAALALGLLMSLPACAQERDDQIIGTPPTVGCCWGYAPDGAASVALRPDQPEIAARPSTPDSMRREHWE
jgi:hypothetical protein